MEMLCQNNLPLRDTPLVHAITNGITNEFVANSLLAIGAKPIMAEDRRELEAVIQVADGLLLNLGQMSPVKEESIRQAAHLASAYGKPVVVDAVGITKLSNRLQLVKDLLSLSKLSAPLTICWAKICASNKSKCSISATPQINNENATGIPNKMEPNKAERKIITVMNALL